LFVRLKVTLAHKYVSTLEEGQHARPTYSVKDGMG
jgi:hypothetical protein